MRNSIFLFLFISSSISGQSKFEKEFRIKESIVPIKALNFISEIEQRRKVKWYREESLDGKSIEAKFNIGKTKYSIEFDTLGQIEDIEESIKLTNLDTNLNRAINNQLAYDFKKYKVIKSQRQLTGDEQQLIKCLKDKNIQLISGYEIVLKGRKGKLVNLYEYFFNESGKIESKRKIIVKSSVHLEY